MRRTEFIEALHGGFIEHYALDLHRNAVMLRVDVLDSGRLSSHEVTFEKVSHFAFDTDSRSDAGDRLQLTELWVDAGPEESATEEWALTISIFDLSHLRLRCSMILIDGEPVL